MIPENDNFKDFKIALGRQVTNLHKKHEDEVANLRSKIESLEKSRAYLQARASIETAKINREYRARLSELDSREKNLAQEGYGLIEREKKIDRELAEKDSIIQKLNLRTVEIESGLVSEFNQKLRSAKSESQRKDDEIEILKKNYAAAENDSVNKLEARKLEIRELNDKRKEEILSLSSQFAVERGEFERDKFTTQQNIKALKNTVNALKDEHRKMVSEYEDKLKIAILSAAEGKSSLGNALEEMKIEGDSLRRKLDELRLTSRRREEELTKKHENLVQGLSSEIQSKTSETEMLRKSVAEIKKINESLKDSYNGKIADIESISRSVEIELRNSLSESAAAKEHLETALQKSLENFASKEDELKNEIGILEKDLRSSREKSREMENKSSAEYLTLADEKRHLQELFEKEIASLKEKLIQRQSAMASMETAAARTQTGLHIKAASLEDANKNLQSEISLVRADMRKIEDIKNAKIAELNLLVKEREKEAAARFAELSEKKGFLELNLRNEKLNRAEDIEDRDKIVSELKNELESVRLAFDIRANAAEKEKRELERNVNVRLEAVKEKLEESENNVRKQADSFAGEMREKDVYSRAQEEELQKIISSKEAALFQMRDEMQRKLAEKDEKNALETDNLRRIIMSNSRKFQDEKEILSEKIREGESNYASALNAHRKEIEGMEALRASEKESLNNSIAALTGKLGSLTEDLEKSRESVSALSVESAELAAKLAAEKEDKRNVIQSFNERLLVKQEDISDRDRQIDKLNSDFSDMIKAKDFEIRRLAEEINKLSSLKSESEEALMAEREKIASENRALKEELDSARAQFRDQMSDSGKKLDVARIEKAAEVDKLKLSAAALKEALGRVKSESLIAKDDLKKHYMELFAEKDRATAALAETYEKKLEELNFAIRKMDAAIKKSENAYLAREEEFRKEKAGAAASGQKEKEEFGERLESRIKELEQNEKDSRQEIKRREKEFSSEKDNFERRIEALESKISELRLLRENEAGKANGSVAELTNQLKMRDMKLREEIKKRQESSAAASDEIVDLNGRLRREAKDYESRISKREDEYGKEISFLRAELAGVREEIKEAQKKASSEKHIIADNFAERARLMESAFNDERMKFNNEIRELTDINRALEEELSSIRARLEAFKSEQK
ncbi:hypothetical protein KJ633_03865 [bacterium]|nr:hypothetical protein [bacterium]